jgi:hypothetical protein
MKRKVFAPTMILALLFSMSATTLDAGYCMPLSSEVHVYDETDVYDIGGSGVNVTITLDKPENKPQNFTMSFTVKVNQNYMTVAPSDYFLYRKSLDYYLTSDVILDYDKARAIDTLWINWGNSRNKTHIEETKELFRHTYGVDFTKSDSTYYGKAVLPELSEGSHNVTVWVEAELDQVTTSIPLWAAFSKTITFTIDTVAPNVTLLTPEDAVYKESEAILNFTVNEPFSELAYCLDGQENVTISGNTTLTGLLNGDHNVTVYAIDEFGNAGVSETVYFSVDVPFPTILVIASVITVAIVGVGLLFYFKKRKH